jgi:hypothetical protein
MDAYKESFPERATTQHDDALDGKSREEKTTQLDSMFITH